MVREKEKRAEISLTKLESDSFLCNNTFQLKCALCSKHTHTDTGREKQKTNLTLGVSVCRS